MGKTSQPLTVICTDEPTFEQWKDLEAAGHLVIRSDFHVADLIVGIRCHRWTPEMADTKYRDAAIKTARSRRIPRVKKPRVAATPTTERTEP